MATAAPQTLPAAISSGGRSPSAPRVARGESVQRGGTEADEADDDAGHAQRRQPFVEPEVGDQGAEHRRGRIEHRCEPGVDVQRRVREQRERNRRID
jgi:hypothetical protein